MTNAIALGKRDLHRFNFAVQDSFMLAYVFHEATRQFVCLRSQEKVFPVRLLREINMLRRGEVRLKGHTA
ncbi:hypothetical protein EUGRSUZ_F02728 [Eucalyptus grandis]|uniref:Uncharacterized protein n=2 Tax=Eucalyptus grandis TaxID=71139 RepID=A0ACC3KJD1_EUCGR|nr:hypothetical protein EUGRSUZ_F02728 [Eucalyptus grandis]